MVLSARTSWFLVAFGVWSWFIWPNFLRNIWNDPRSFEDGPQPFFLVHLVLVVVSLALGTAIAAIGVRGLRGARRHPRT
ncbi:SCO4848 family membrane protein [Kineococcus auxinigenes]|uniref:SCO4848 family membrane protein n=1 Tax=unclassified Kineococcus TaxID=2621656 RepID=UPI003D7C46CB